MTFLKYIVSFIVLTLFFAPANGAEQLGYADKFVSCNAECGYYSPGYYWNCDFLNYVNGYNGGGTFAAWAYIGQQGANATGRANAEERVFTKFRDEDSLAYTVSITISRYRLTGDDIQFEDADCLGGTLVTSTTTTYTSTGFSPADLYANNRLLPALNFSAETAAAGTVVGYRSVVTATWDTGEETGSRSSVGCYKIRWI